jgi:phage terminase small subunit
MAGVKGKSGGHRPGAGRKPAPKAPEPETVVTDQRDPLPWLLDVMQGLIEPTPAQLRAAVAAAQYVHAKKEGGKKDEAADRAKTAGAGKFGAIAAPRLAAAGGKKV